MKLDIKFKLKRIKERVYVVEFFGKDNALIIGQKGKTLNSFEYILNSMIKNCRIEIDVERFKEKRNETLRILAKRMAEKVSKYGKTVRLNAMPPRERKIIHEVVNKYPDLDTYSEGRDPKRYIVIKKKDRKERLRVMLLDTIAAISTPRGEGGISIVRMSGQDSLNILEKIFRPKNKKVSELKNYSINYGHIIDNEHIVDEVLVSIMKAPNTYTREDIVEINCHGGFLVTEKVLEVVLKNGARIAEIGEFTKRAFLNGRIDLTQAEAVIDVIHGKTEKSLSLSLNQLRGDLRDKITTIKKSILDLAAHINVVLDYPEEGIDDPVPENLVDNLKKLQLK